MSVFKGKEFADTYLFISHSYIKTALYIILEHAVLLTLITTNGPIRLGNLTPNKLFICEVKRCIPAPDVYPLIATSENNQLSWPNRNIDNRTCHIPIIKRLK